MANPKQQGLVAHKIRSALGNHLPRVMRNGANMIYADIAENVKDFTNAQVSLIIDLMNALEEDEVTKQEALDKLVEWKVIPERRCGICHQTHSTCCC